jgi:hypothetical protein
VLNQYISKTDIYKNHINDLELLKSNPPGGDIGNLIDNEIGDEEIGDEDFIDENKVDDMADIEVEVNEVNDTKKSKKVEATDHEVKKVIRIVKKKDDAVVKEKKKVTKIKKRAD